ncbi:MAG: CHAT domain-containing protein, partial [Candidatus Oleimicrobiaceae bacterium]
SAEANLAALLSAEGAPFVLGMQLSVGDIAARNFTRAFYRFLFAGEDIFEAVRQARLNVLGESSLVMGIPVLYAADPSAPGVLPRPGGGLTVREPPTPRLEGLPTLEVGFFGRQRELVRVGELLTADRPRQGDTWPPLTVTLHGMGGIGKTAVLIKAAQRLAWNYAHVLAVPLEPLP